MNRILFAGALLAFSNVCSAQDGTVQGVVSDSAFKETLPGVSILFTHPSGYTGRSVSTDINGAFTATLPAGDWTVLLRSIGYTDKRIPLHVEAGGQQTVTVGMTASAAQLDQVVVSAGKFEQRVGEVTQSLSVLPPNIVKDKNITSLEDALVQVPGVVVVDNEPQIRSGSGYSQGAGSRVMILVDDMPILSGDIGRPSWSFMPIENLEQVEVIKGASSVLYGSAALSGVINARTAYPRLEPRTRATVYSGIWGAPGHKPAKWWHDNAPLFGGASFSHAQQYGPFDLVVGGMVFGDQGYVGPERVNPDSLIADPLRTGISGGYDQRARVNVGTRWRNRKVKGLSYGINANFMRSRSSSTFIWDNTDDGLFRPKPGTITETRAQHYYVDPYINYRGPLGMRHVLRGRYYDQINDNNNNQSNASQNYYGEYQVQKKANLLGETTVTAGIVMNVTNSTAVLYSGDPDGDGHNRARSTAGYLQLDKRFLQERLMVSGGVRYETFKVNNYEKGQPVYRAGATWRVLRATYLRGSYGQGFRFPTLGERYIRTKLDAVSVLPNEQLEPEFSVNVEAGIKQGFRIGGFSGYVDAVVFRQDIDRYVEFTFAAWEPGTPQDPLGGLGFRSVNTGGARITGLELEVVGKGNIGAVEITALAGYTHTKPVSTTPHEVYATSLGDQPLSYSSTSCDTTDYLLKYRMRDLIRADLSGKHKRISAGVSVRYNSHIRNIDKAFLDFDRLGVMRTGVNDWMRGHTTGDWIVDARIGYQLTAQLKASIIGNNLGNEVYSIRPMSIEAPRSWQVQLTAEL